jgi:hypothetical protein
MDERMDEWPDEWGSVDLAGQRSADAGSRHYRNHEDVKKEVVR